MAKDKTYPRFPESNWWTLRDQFSKSLPPTVTVGYLKSLLRLGTEKAAKNLLPMLRQLGLIDENLKPTPLANDWRSNTKYADTCQQIIENIYDEELRNLYSGNEVDRGAVEEWFKYNAELGEAAARQSAAMYILLNDATPKSSEDFKKKPTATKPADVKKNDDKKSPPVPKAAQSNDGVKTQPTPEHTPIPVIQSPQDNKLSLHIDLQIHISPDATLEQIDKIFESIGKHLGISAKRD